MKNISIIKACSDLGVNKDGTELGPDIIMNNTKTLLTHEIYRLEKISCIKELDKNIKRKNIKYINEFNARLYHLVSDVLNKNYIPLTLGGDHSITISTALASLRHWKSLGIIWIDAHSDFHTFETTITGNIHGLSLSTIAGQNSIDLCNFHKSTFFSPSNIAIVGARSIDYPGEYNNLKKAGITIFTTEDIKNEGIKQILKKAINIACYNTNGIHVSIDIDVLDSQIAPGVSVQELNGINEEEFYSIIDTIIRNENLIKSIDFAEYNPSYDFNNKTLKIVTKALDKFLNNNLNLF